MATTPVTVDNLSWRLQRAAFYRRRMREDAQDLGQKKNRKAKTLRNPRLAVDYFNHYLQLGLPRLPMKEEDAVIMMYDLANFPLDMVHNRMVNA